MLHCPVYNVTKIQNRRCWLTWERCRPSVRKRLRKIEKDENGTDAQFSTEKARNNARPPDTAKLRCNIVNIISFVFLFLLGVPQTKIACGSSACQLNQQNSFSWALLRKMCLHWAYFIWLTAGVATILCCCAKLVFMLFTIVLWHRGLKH